MKPGKENNDTVSKYQPISLLNVVAKVLEKLVINRIMHHLHSRDLLSRNQFGFTPQTGTVTDHRSKILHGQEHTNKAICCNDKSQHQWSL